MSSNQNDDKTSSVENYTRAAKSLYDKAIEARDNWSSDKQSAAVNTLMSALRENSPKRLGIGIQDIKGELKKTLKNEKFNISSETENDVNIEFYRVTLFAFFRRETKTKFTSAEISVKVINSSNVILPQIYSIAPLNVNERVSVKKTFALNPKIELCEVKVDPGLSYTYTKEYAEIHPLIIALFAAKQDVTWQYMTSAGVKEIAGTQTLELIIKQPVNTSSEWEAGFPEVQLEWRGRIVKLRSKLRNRKVPVLEPKFENFNVPP